MENRTRETRNRALHALSLMRRGWSLQTASHDAGTTPSTVLRHVGQALRETSEGWRPTPQDDLSRTLLFLAPDGPVFITVRGSERASLIGSYWNAVRLYLEEGDDRELRRFAGRSIIDVSGNRHGFVTEPRTIRRLARAGQVSGFNSIY
jgi:hypothetical protein